MASKSSFFDPTSPFITYATAASRGVIINLLRITAMTRHARMSEAFHIYFDGTNLTEKMVGFKMLLNKYLGTCCDEYLSIHQQVLDGKLEKSDLNEDNMDHYVYCTLEKIMSRNDGYKHLNCIFDGLMMFCSFQFKHVFALLSSEDVTFGSSAIDRSGIFTAAELNILRQVLNIYLDEVNVKAQNLYVDDDEYKNYRLKCEENDSCKLKIEDEKQRLEQQDELIRQTIHNRHDN